MCDGAKPSCSLKLMTGVSTAVLSAMLAMENHSVSSVEGIIDDDVDKSIRNLTLIGRDGMNETDHLILKIMTYEIRPLRKITSVPALRPVRLFCTESKDGAESFIRSIGICAERGTNYPKPVLYGKGVRNDRSERRPIPAFRKRYAGRCSSPLGGPSCSLLAMRLHC